MTKKTFQMIAISAVAVSFLVIAGCAKHRPESFEKKLDLMAEKLTKELKLTAEQQKTVADIKAAILEKREQMKRPDRAAEEKEIKKAFSEAILTEKFDQEKLKKLLNSKKDKMDEMRDFMLKELALFHSVLTPEQRKDFVKILEKVPFPQMGPGMGPGRREPGGFEKAPGRQGPYREEVKK